MTYNSKSRKSKKKNRIFSNNIRTIKKSFPRFVSLMVMSILGVFVFAGLMATAPDMIGTLDKYLDSRNVYDIRVVSSLGLTDEDTETLSALSGVKEVEAVHSCDVMASWMGSDGTEIETVMNVTSMPELLNKIELESGRLPENAGEIVVEDNFLKKNDLEIGDTIHLDDETFTEQDPVITGTVDSALYYNNVGLDQNRGNTSIGSGKISYYAYMPAESFDQDYYTAIYLTVDGALPLITSEEDYVDKVQAVMDEIDGITDKCEMNRYDSLVADAEDQIADARADADEQLAEAQKKLSDAKKQLDEGWDQLESGKKQLDSAKVELDTGKDTLEASEKTLAEAKTALESGAEELKEGEAELLSAMAQIEDGEEELDAAKEQLDSYQTLLDAGRDRLAETKEQLDAAQKTLEDKQDQYDQAIKSNNLEGKDLNELKTQITDGEAQLNAGIEKLDRMITVLDQVSGAASGLEDRFNEIAENTASGAISAEEAVSEYEAAITDVINNLSGLTSELDEILDGKLSAFETAGFSEERKEEIRAEISAYLEEVQQGSREADPEEIKAYLAALYTESGYEEAVSNLSDEVSSLLESGILDGLTIEDIESDGIFAITDKLQESKSGFEQQLSDLQTRAASLDQLQEARNALNDGWNQYKSGTEAYEAGLATWTAQKAVFDEAKETYQAGAAKLIAAKEQYASGKATYDAGKASYEENLAAYEQGLSSYHAGLSEYEEGLASYEKSKQEYEEKLAEYYEGKAEYEDGIAEYEKAKKEADEKIADAQKQIADIPKAVIYVYDRTGYSTYTDYIDDSNSIRNLAKLFPVVFFAVAVLVSLISMNRMVEEDRLEIGTMKSLGFENTTIISKYLLFSLLATVEGGFLGAAGGLIIIPELIFSIYTILFTLPPLQFTLQPASTLLGFALTVLCVCGTSVWTAWQVLNEKPSELMRPKAPKMGRKILLERIGWLWNRLSFSRKVTVRNIFRYKKRVLVTIGGIAGCTALMLTGFGVKDSIVDVPSAQYYEVYQFDGTAYVTNADTQVIADNPEVTESTRAQRITADIEGINGFLQIVTDDAGMKTIADFKDSKTGETLILKDGEAIINEKLATMKNLHVGEEISLVDVDNNTISVTVGGIAKNYIEHFVYINQKTYEDLGYTFTPNLIYFHMQSAGEEEKETLTEELLNTDDVINVTYRSNLIESVDNSLKSLNKVVLILIVLAAMLAFVVLYNLSNININERKREIATLKVLGFYDQEVDHYITSETMILTVLGIGLGLLLGIFLSHMVVATIEVEKCRFINKLKLPSYIYSSAMSACFTLIVNWITHFNLKHINMIDSLKSVE